MHRAEYASQHGAHAQGLSCLAAAALALPRPLFGALACCGRDGGLAEHHVASLLFLASCFPCLCFCGLLPQLLYFVIEHGYRLLELPYVFVFDDPFGLTLLLLFSPFLLLFSLVQLGFFLLDLPEFLGVGSSKNWHFRFCCFFNAAFVLYLALGLLLY